MNCQALIKLALELAKLFEQCRPSLEEVNTKLEAE